MLFPSSNLLPFQRSWREGLAIYGRRCAGLLAVALASTLVGILSLSLFSLRNLSSAGLVRTVIWLPLLVTLGVVVGSVFYRWQRRRLQVRERGDEIHVMRERLEVLLKENNLQLPEVDIELVEQRLPKDVGHVRVADLPPVKAPSFASTLSSRATEKIALEEIRFAEERFVGQIVQAIKYGYPHPSTHVHEAAHGTCREVAQAED